MTKPMSDERLSEATNERDRARADAKQWHDTYQDAMNAVDKFFGDLLDMLPGATDEGADAYDQIPRGIRNLTAERDRLAEQVKHARELHRPVCGGACGLDDACECADRDLVCEECSDSCPCPTIRALDGTENGR